MFARARLAGVQSACGELGLVPPLVDAVPAPDALSVPDLAAVLASWTAGPDPITGVACYNDFVAAACLAAADRAGLSVPGQLAVVGMDDEAMSGFTRPALTTVRLHMADYARHLWSLAAAALTGEAVPRGTGGGACQHGRTRQHLN